MNRNGPFQDWVGSIWDAFFRSVFICLFILNVIPYVISGDKRNSVTRTNSRKFLNDNGLSFP